MRKLILTAALIFAVTAPVLAETINLVPGDGSFALRRQAEGDTAAPMTHGQRQ